MCGRKHRDNALCVVKAWKNLLAELKVRPDRTVRNHHALGESRCSGSVVDYCKLLCRILIIIEIILGEFLRIPSSEKLVQVLLCVDDPLIPGIKQLESVHLDDSLYIRHFTL